jgi:hypothetical protein
MPAQLASIVAQARIARLALIGLAKNVGKTTTTNHLLETLLGGELYRAEELALTSLGLDGEAIDALTGLPKPRYVPQAGLIVATTADLLDQAESTGAKAARGINIRVADPIRILALTINPYTPDYQCSPQRLMDALLKELPAEHPPIIDVVSGLRE